MAKSGCTYASHMLPEALDAGAFGNSSLSSQVKKLHKAKKGGGGDRPML